MKKLFGIFLIACLVVPFAGTFTWLHYQKKNVRKQIKREIIAGIDRKELVLLTFTKQETENKLSWVHTKEFEYNDVMYDIVETETKDGIIYYWCWWDHQETKLNKQLNKLLAQFLGNDRQTRETKDRLITYYQNFYHSKTKPWQASNIEVYQKNQYNPYIFNYTSLHFPPVPQPPNCI